jgi:ATP-dependent RNA helicase SUPV3L1/SUV3
VAGAPAREHREHREPREERDRPRERFEGKGRDRDNERRRDKFGGERKGDRNDRERGGRDHGRDKGGRDKRESGPSHRPYASSASPRDRDRPVDPNSPFAKLAALKEQLTANRKD